MMSTQSNPKTNRRLGIAIVGLGGAVATTAVAGMLQQRRGADSKAGLPLAEHDHLDLTAYSHIEFGGWDLYSDNLYQAARKHGVLSERQLEEYRSDLEAITPWMPVSNRRFCEGVTVEGKDTNGSLREQIAQIQDQLTVFRKQVDAVVLINLASTETAINLDEPAFQSADAFELALTEDSTLISPAMLYAYAAVTMGIPYGNFTPSVAVDIPALLELAVRHRVPVAGKDGKTGQTFVKTVLAPSLRARALEVDGWFSTNILGNRDGEALRKAGSLQSKINTKGTVLDSCLGYPVENHIVQIHYYKPRGDNKEAWDNIDVTGFLGHQMQLKVNFLCKDSILAAPLVIEIARCLEFAHRKGERGAAEAMGVFFKAPLTSDFREPEHRFEVQQQALLNWLNGLQNRDTVPTTAANNEAASA